LTSFLPEQASAANPVDMIASAGGPEYARTIRTVAADPGIDALIVIYIPPLESSAHEVARHMVEAIGSIERRIPVLTCFMSARGLPEPLRAPGVRIPSYAYPEQAAIALAHAVELGAWRAKPLGAFPVLAGIREDEAAAVLAGALGREGGWLDAGEVRLLFECYGLPTVREAPAATTEEAERVSHAFEGHVALKAVGPIHKTDVGAVALDLAPGPAVAAAAAAIAQRVEAAGVEMLVGAAADPMFGGMIAVGAGGVTVELTRDVEVRVAPLTDVDADEMIRGLATFPLLDGFRGAPKADVDALRDVVLRVSALCADHAEIAEMDCNPVIVRANGAAIVDARVRVQLPEPIRPFASRGGG
ncbi:MAG: acetate--CoA ligase family protein, partial [Actinomycetota bacterium]